MADKSVHQQFQMLNGKNRPRFNAEDFASTASDDSSDAESEAHVNLEGRQADNGDGNDELDEEIACATEACHNRGGNECDDEQLSIDESLDTVPGAVRIRGASYRGNGFMSSELFIDPNDTNITQAPLAQRVAQQESEAPSPPTFEECETSGSVQIVTLDDLEAEYRNRYVQNAVQVKKIPQNRGLFRIAMGVVLVLLVSIGVVTTVTVGVQQETKPNYAKDPASVASIESTPIPTTMPTILTPSPTPIPPARTELLEFIATISPSDDEAFNINSSPQYKAFQWLFHSLSNPESAMMDSPPARARIAARYASATLYFATNGPEWVIQTNWLDPNKHVCLWHDADPLGEEICTFYDGIRYLDLVSNRLQGPIPREIGLVGDLIECTMNDNKLTGSIPTELFGITSLESIQLFNNRLVGSLPSEVGQLTTLYNLNLERNQLSATVPTEIGNLSLLQELHLGNNIIEGEIPTEVGKLSYLKHWVTPRVAWKGNIPTEFGLLSNQLQTLDIEGANFTLNATWIPSELYQLKKLRTLRLVGSNLIGTISPMIGTLTNLEQLDLSSNNLSGQVPSEIGLLSNLTTLRIKSNAFTGTIPMDVSAMTSLFDVEL